MSYGDFPVLIVEEDPGAPTCIISSRADTLIEPPTFCKSDGWLTHTKNLQHESYLAWWCQIGFSGMGKINRHRLYQKLFVEQEYDPNIQPRLNYYDGNTVVYVTMHLKTINSLDPVSEVLQTSVFLEIEWRDVYLKWYRSLYDGINVTIWPQDYVWKPDIILYNSVHEYRPLGHKSIMVDNYRHGWIKWFPMELFETSCSVDMTYFPFDIQTCEIQLIPWSYTTVTLRIGEDMLGLTNYHTNAFWEILDTSVDISEVFYAQVVVFKIKMQRKPQHHIVTLILPVLLLAISNIFATVIPIGGDRLGYAVTVFLSFSVFLTIVDSVMPSNAEKVSLFSVYLVIQTSQATINTIWAALLTRAESLDDSTKIPHVLVVLDRKCRGLCKKKKTAKVIPQSNAASAIEADIHDADDGMFSVKSTDEATPCTWMMVLKTIDAIAFILLALVSILSTAVFIVTVICRPT